MIWSCEIKWNFRHTRYNGYATMNQSQELGDGISAVPDPDIMAILWRDSFVELHNEIFSTSDIIYIVMVQ